MNIIPLEIGMNIIPLEIGMNICSFHHVLCTCCSINFSTKDHQICEECLEPKFEKLYSKLDEINIKNHLKYPVVWTKLQDVYRGEVLGICYYVGVSVCANCKFKDKTLFCKICTTRIVRYKFVDQESELRFEQFSNILPLSYVKMGLIGNNVQFYLDENKRDILYLCV